MRLTQLHLTEAAMAEARRLTEKKTIEEYRAAAERALTTHAELVAFRTRLRKLMVEKKQRERVNDPTERQPGA
jgi:hypothetical protein